MKDLGNCLSGPAVVAYGERHASGESLDAVFDRAISIPTTPNKSDSQGIIEGISVLPTSAGRYEKMVGNSSEIRQLPLFRYAHSVVVVISASEGRQLDFHEIKRIRELVDLHFPSAQIKRYALVVGSSPKTSITLLISGSAFSTFDVFYHFLNYVNRCFAKDDVDEAELKEVLELLLDDEKFDSERLEKLLNEYEDLRPILVSGEHGSWEQKKLEVEQQFRRLKHSGVVSTNEFKLDDLLLQSQDVIATLRYVHRFEHKEVLKDIRSDRY